MMPIKKTELRPSLFFACCLIAAYVLAMFGMGFTVPAAEQVENHRRPHQHKAHEAVPFKNLIKHHNAQDKLYGGRNVLDDA